MLNSTNQLDLFQASDSQHLTALTGIDQLEYFHANLNLSYVAAAYALAYRSRLSLFGLRGESLRRYWVSPVRAAARKHLTLAQLHKVAATIPRI